MYMKALYTLLIACFGLAAMPLHAKPAADIIKNRPKGPTLKILLAKDTEGALVEVKGAYNLYDPFKNNKLESAFSASSFFMYPTTEGLKWGVEYPGIFQLAIVPDRPDTTVLVNGIEYKGMIYAYQINGTIGFVNEVSIDDYVESLLSAVSETDVKEQEAIAALAIAYRTHAQMLCNLGKFWDVQASDVGYHGSAVVRHDKPFQEASKLTQRMIMSIPAINWFGEKGKLPLEQIEKMATQGLNAKAILKQFYPEAQLEITNP